MNESKEEAKLLKEVFYVEENQIDLLINKQEFSKIVRIVS